MEEPRKNSVESSECISIPLFRLLDSELWGINFVFWRQQICGNFYSSPETNTDVSIIEKIINKHFLVKINEILRESFMNFY